jgi:glyoxylase-like metal-dependent hydrolase (beta-lactamase superfamily II)
MSTQLIAPGVTQIALAPRQAINAYLIGSVLIDAGVRSSLRALLNALGTQPLSAHALTHAHADHQGASAAICAHFGIPLWCSAAERQAAETGQIAHAMPNPRDPLVRIQQRFFAGPSCPVARELKEGDMIEDFCVLETPGHAPGHVAFWRERDGVLIAGDVLNNMNLLTTIPGLREPPTVFTVDPQQNRQSIKKLAALKPKIVGFGHGPVLRNPEALQALAARL